MDESLSSCCWSRLTSLLKLPGITGGSRGGYQRCGKDVEAVYPCKMTPTLLSNTCRCSTIFIWCGCADGWVLIAGMVQAWVAHFVTPLKCMRTSATGKSRVKNHTKIKNHLPNTITMVVEPLSPPAPWIWRTHATWGVGGLSHVRSKAAVEAI
jgi:hypothetical protein